MAQLFKDFDESGPLARVREGMAVYDQADKRVGKVRAIHFGEGNASAVGAGPTAATAGHIDEGNDSLLAGVGAAYATDPGGLPEGARDSLLRTGYLAIDAAGIFTGDRFATPDQIATVGDDRVTLRVGNDDLIRG